MRMVVSTACILSPPCSVRNICVLDDFIGSGTIIRVFCLVWGFTSVFVASSNFYNLICVLKSHVVRLYLLKCQQGFGLGWGWLSCWCAAPSAEVWGASPALQLGWLQSALSRPAPLRIRSRRVGLSQGHGMQPTCLAHPPLTAGLALSHWPSSEIASQGFLEDFILIIFIEISSWAEEKDSGQSPTEVETAGQVQQFPTLPCLCLTCSSVSLFPQLRLCKPTEPEAAQIWAFQRSIGGAQTQNQGLHSHC